MFDSGACMKDDPSSVTTLLSKLTSMTAKYDALKKNITIRVKGFNWDWCKHAWTKNGRKYTIDELANHLRWIITEEKKKRLEVQTVPEPNVLKRKNMGILGTQTDLSANLNEKYLADEGEIRKKADRIQQGRKYTGEASMYSCLQP